MVSKVAPKSLGRAFRTGRPLRSLFGWFGLALVAAGLSFAPAPAHAQGVDSQVRSLIDQASNDYDTLKISSAKQKLEKAIKLGKQKGASKPVLARAYVMFGIVDFGATKEKKRALKAFKEAAKRDAEASIPEVYKTPTLAKLMEKAHSTTKTPQTGTGETGPGTGPKRDVDTFTHEPLSSAQAGEPLLVEAFVPPDMTVGTVTFVFKRYNQESWNRLELKATNATRFAKKVRGCHIYTSQLSYYIQVANPSGKVVAESASESAPHSITVLGSAGVDVEKLVERCKRKPKPEPKAGAKPTPQPGGPKPGGPKPPPEPGPEPGPSGPVAYFDLAGGSAAGYLPNKLPPTANPDRIKDLNPGATAAFAHFRIGGGYMFSSSSQLGLYFRFQFLPAQDFATIRKALPDEDYRGFRDGPCLGTGLPGDCLLGLNYRYFFSSSSALQFFSSVGGGVGLVRDWIRLKEPASSSFCQDNNKTTYPSETAGGPDRFCYRTDTVRPGWLHFGVGGGMAYKFSDSVALLTEAYLQVLFPDTALNLDLNIGPQFRF